MGIKKVTLQLYKQAEAAAKDLDRLDSVERYVLLKVITAAEQKLPIDEVFIKCAKKVLANQPAGNASVAA
ncbi:MAG: hypothetical protein ACI85N_002240 [Gammaproteobacteria bacterium]|jgi:hypothetical protein